MFIRICYNDLLGDDASISKESFMRTRHLFVLIHIRNKVEVGTIKLVLPSRKIFLLTLPRRCFFCESFLFFMLVFVMLSCRLIAAQCHLLVKKAHILALLYVMFSCVFGTCPFGVLGRV